MRTRPILIQTKRGKTHFEQAETKARLQEELEESKRRARAAKQNYDACAKALKSFGPEGRDLAKLETTELEEWETTLLETNVASQDFQRMLDLSEEWQLKFSNSKELYPAILSSAQVVAGTCIGFAGAKGILDVEFDLCIVDEASKATSSEICVPLSRAEKCVIVGDHKQLPPFLEEGILKKEHLEKYNLTKSDIEETLFERMYRRLPESHKVLLQKQYRMLPEIGDLISDSFYDGVLISESRAPKYDFTLGGITKPVTWISTTQYKKRREISCNPGYKNLLEAEVVCDLLKPLNFCLSNTESCIDVALLSGYADQREELQRQANSVIADLDKLRLESGTVDSFQGRQVDLAIFSVTRSNTSSGEGFLKETRRLNVALSRAKEALIIVGDIEFALGLSPSNPLRVVAEYISRNPNSCEIKR